MSFETTKELEEFLSSRIRQRFSGKSETLSRKSNSKKAMGSGLGYCDLVSSLKKLAYSNAPACGRQGFRNAEYRIKKR